MDKPEDPESVARKTVNICKYSPFSPFSIVSHGVATYFCRSIPDGDHDGLFTLPCFRFGLVSRRG
jgi:hypothetical protein